MVTVNSRRDIFSSKYYIIEWLPKHELRSVSGAFINGHFEKSRVLDGPYQHEKNAIRALAENDDYYKSLLTSEEE